MATIHTPNSFLKEDKDGNRSMSNFLDDGETVVGTGRVDNVPVEAEKKTTKKAAPKKELTTDESGTNTVVGEGEENTGDDNADGAGDPAAE